MDHKHLRRLLVVTAGMSLSCAQGVAEMNRESRAAAALFDGFETVFDSKVPLPGSLGNLPQQNSEALKAPYAYLIEGLKAADETAAREMLASGEAILVGAKDFRAPEGFGSVKSQFCYIIVLAQSSKFELANQFQTGPQQSLDGLGVWRWQTHLFGEPPSIATLYAAQIEGSYLLISNSLSELQSASRRLMGPEPESSTPKSLAGWESISKREFWAYRRYRRGGPVDKVAAGRWGVPRDAESLILFVDLEKKAVSLRLIGPAGNTSASTTVSIHSALPLFQSREPGVWEADIPLSGDQQSIERLFIVMGMFGFGVYL